MQGIALLAPTYILLFGNAHSTRDEAANQIK